MYPRGDLGRCGSSQESTSLSRLRPTSSMLRRTWSSSSTLRGWLGTGMTQLPTRAGCMQLKWGTLLLCYLPPPKLLCLPPLPKMPCCNPDCQRCAAHSGGFKFPWIGLWNTRGVVIPPDVAPSEAWDYYYRHNERMDLILLSAYSSQVTAEELVPQDLYALQLRCSAGDAGALGRGEFFAAWREWALCFPESGHSSALHGSPAVSSSPQGATLGELGGSRQQSSPSVARLVGGSRSWAFGVGFSLHRLR